MEYQWLVVSDQLLRSYLQTLVVAFASKRYRLDSRFRGNDGSRLYGLFNMLLGQYQQRTPCEQELGTTTRRAAGLISSASGVWPR